VTVLVTVLATPLGCLHDWEAYEAPEDGSSGGSSALCADVCATYADCVAQDWASCSSDCTTRIADCPSQSLESLQDCVDEVEADCGSYTSQATWNVCISTSVACMWD
jgi:hypothetical protein